MARMRMTRRTRGVAIVAGAAVSIAAVYVSASYILSPAVSDQGGGAASSSNYEIRGSIGGPVIVTGEKTAASPSYSLEAHSVGIITYREPAGPGKKPPATGGDGGGCSAGAGTDGSPRPSDGAAGLGSMLLLLFAVGVTAKGARHRASAERARSRLE